MSGPNSPLQKLDLHPYTLPVAFELLQGSCLIALKTAIGKVHWLKDLNQTHNKLLASFFATALLVHLVVNSLKKDQLPFLKRNAGKIHLTTVGALTAAAYLAKKITIPQATTSVVLFLAAKLLANYACSQITHYPNKRLAEARQQLAQAKERIPSREDQEKINAYQGLASELARARAKVTTDEQLAKIARCGSAEREAARLVGQLEAAKKEAKTPKEVEKLDKYPKLVQQHATAVSDLGKRNQELEAARAELAEAQAKIPSDEERKKIAGYDELQATIAQLVEAQKELAETQRKLEEQKDAEIADLTKQLAEKEAVKAAYEKRVGRKSLAPPSSPADSSTTSGTPSKHIRSSSTSN